MSDVEQITLYDKEGYIDIEQYIQRINNIIRICCEEVETTKPDSNQVNGFLRVAYRNIFKPEGAMLSGQGKKTNIELNKENVERLIEVYKGVIETWNALPSMEGFERLTGINKHTASEYVTDFSQSIQIARRVYIQNRLNNSPLGVLTLANNDIDTGLLYTRQNIVAHETVKKALSFEDLKRIANNVDIPQHVVSDDN